MVRVHVILLSAICLLLVGCTDSSMVRTQPSTGLAVYALEASEVPDGWRLVPTEELTRAPLSDWFGQQANPQVLEARPWMGGITMAGWLPPGQNTTLYSAVYEAAGQRPSLVVYQVMNRTGSNDAAAMPNVFCDASTPGIQMLASDDVLVTLWVGDADVQDDAYVAQLRAVSKAVANRTGATHICDAGILLDPGGGRLLDLGGDGPEDAYPLEPGSLERGLYLDPGETDWFRFEPGGNGTWSITAEGSADLPLRVEVSDRDLTPVANATGDGGATVEFQADGGPFYVTVRSSSDSAQGSYRLLVA